MTSRATPAEGCTEMNLIARIPVVPLAIAALLITSALPALSEAPDMYDPSILIAEGELTNAVTNPATDGTYVAWQFGADSPATTCKTLYATTLSDPDAFPVETIPKNSGWAISDGMLVWAYQVVECRQYEAVVNPGIFGRDLESGEDFVVTTERVAWNQRTGSHALEFEGRTVTWFTSDPDASGRYLLRTRSIDGDAQPFTVATVASDIEVALPRIHEEIFYWLEWPADGSPSRIVRAIAGGEPETVILDREIAWFDVQAGVIVWRTADMLKARELGSNVVRDIAAVNPYDVSAPVTDGRYAFVGLQAYDIATGSQFPVIEYDPVPDTSVLAGITSYQNGVIVWHYMEHGFTTGKTEIRAAQLVSVLPTAPRPPGLQRARQTYYPETGHYLGWGFRDYWTANGGLPVFGYPLTEEFQQVSDTGLFHNAQYFERQRFEWHPENAGTPYEVLLGRLGAEQASQLGLLETDSFIAREENDSPGDGCAYFAPTGHFVCDALLTYWRDHGLEFGDAGVTYQESLALFGYPLSEPFITTNADGDTVLTQYFERAVFEHHPQNQEPYTVLLRRLGVEFQTAQDW